MSSPSRRPYGIALVLIGTVLWSSGGLFVRALEVDLATMMVWRSLFGGLSLLAITAFTNGGRWRQTARDLGRPGLIAIPLSTLSMIAYVASLVYTTVANVMIIYATLPFVAAAVAYLWTGERIGPRVARASTVALLGILVVAGASSRPEDVAGNVLAFVMTASFAVILVLARRHPQVPMAPVNGLAAAIAALVFLPFASPEIPPPDQLAILAGFGFVTSGLAYLVFLVGGRHIPSGEAGLIALLDVVLGPLWVWLAFSEDPGLPAIVGGSLVLGAVGWYLIGETRRPAATSA